MGIGVIFLGCAHTREEPPLPESEKNSQVFEASEKIIVRAVTQVLKERGFGQAKVEKTAQDESRLDTEFVTKGDWRTKAEATVKKLNRKENELTVKIITEQKKSGSSEWTPKKIMGKEQYEKLLDEIDTQIYRELGKGE